MTHTVDFLHEQDHRIMNLYDSGMGRFDIARELNLNPTYVVRIIGAILIDRQNEKTN